MAQKKTARLPKFKPGQGVYLRWLDAMTVDEWSSEKAHEPPSCETIGWFLRADETTITLASTVASDVGWFSQVVIPIGCIVEWKRVTHK